MTTKPTTVTTTLRRRRGLTEEAAIAAVDQACRRLRLPTVRAVVDEALVTANREQLSYQGFLAELLLAECDDRDRRSSIRRVASRGASGSVTSISTRTRTSTRPRSTNSLPVTGSAKANRSASSATPVPGNRIY